MIVVKKSIVKIVGAINTMLFSECCHSYFSIQYNSTFRRKMQQEFKQNAKFQLQKSKTKNLIYVTQITEGVNLCAKLF